MKTDPAQTVYGQSAPTPRLTPFGAALIAICVAIPGGAIIGVVWAVLF
ncbi:hypothetical protein [Aestuariibius sp. HNIBRBA575]